MTDIQSYKTIVLIPVYNSREHLKRLLPALFDTGLAIMILDDGSTDGLIEAEIHPAQFVRFPQNRGKGAVLKDGFEMARAAGFDFAVTLDADGQHPVTSVPAFLKSIKEPTDFVIGHRNWNMTNMPWSRIVSNTVTSWLLSRRTGLKIYDSQIGFRCYPLVNPELWSVPEGGFQFESAIFLKIRTCGLNLKWVDVPVIYDDEPSHMHHFRDTWKFIRFYLRSFWT